MTEEGRTEVASRMAEAAQAWLATLDRDQRDVATGQVPRADRSDDERRRWTYLPTDHGGLTAHEQRPAQQQAAMRLVASGLSRPGYVTVATVIGLENVLDELDGFADDAGDRDRERGRDPGLYYLRVFGDPAGSAPWGWRFGGHHVSLNNLVVDGAVVATTPCFLGADPAAAPLLGGTVSRPLGQVEDLARQLVQALPPELVARAVLDTRAPADVLSRDRSRVRPGPPDGVAAAELDARQRDLLRALLATYLGRVPEEVSPLGRYDEDAVLDEVHLAWAGSTLSGEPHYYRLQGPGLLVEWDNTQRGANHGHSVWRDPEGDFGADVLARHRAAHH